MKFYCYEYSNTASGRAMAYSRSGGGTSINGLTKEKAQIFVPAPVNFTSQTSHNYVNQPTTALTILPPLVEQVIEGAISLVPGANEAAEAAKAVYDGINQAMDLIDSAAGRVTGMISDIPDDVNDMTYVPTGASRTFEIRINLPCLSERDSMAAGEIIRAFEALSLPTGRSALRFTGSKFFHPPLWVFGIGPIDSFKFDPDWTGFPQISVLRTVSHRKTALETNSLSAIGHNGLLKPVAYTLTLVFQELEPAFRVTGRMFQATNMQITNRSGVIATTGTNGLANTVTVKGG